MATPQARFYDETQGMSLGHRVAEGRKLTRYLFMPLDIIDPSRKRQQEGRYAAGGEEIESFCLRRSFCRNYVPRCVLTPLEEWIEPMGIREWAGERMGELVPINQGPHVQPTVPIDLAMPQLFRQREPMMGMPHYPGEDIALIMEQHGHKGVGEIPALRGHLWDEGEAQRIQNEFFPADWPMPIELRLIEERVREVGKNGLSEIADQMLARCDASRQFAMAYINVQHGLLRTRKEHQWTYSYSAIARQLLAQVEIPSFDDAQGAQYASLVKAVVAEMVGHQPQNQVVDIAEIVKQVMLGMKAAEAPEVETPPAEFPCDGCERTFETLAGLASHKRNTCKAKTE